MLTALQGFIVKFAITPAHEADVTVARALLDEVERGLTLGDKAYLGSRVYISDTTDTSFGRKTDAIKSRPSGDKTVRVRIPPKADALRPGVWTTLMDAAHKTIESVSYPLTRTKFLVFG